MFAYDTPTALQQAFKDVIDRMSDKRICKPEQERTDFRVNYFREYVKRDWQQ